ncbi:f9c329ba-5889-4ef1-b35b-1caa0c51d422 [Thermothielavioides terrestris]|uniref:ribonuclease Z n=1 Tax=Thermothielavioides terrestris TaxID=2587410 RepID=A0A3S4B616_9PEZI|nr:f9c329ba-5889-4ef1-b35b-1caa0c51d422 [Thermothielavioides terrestris]
MLAYVQIVSVPSADTPGACLMLHFDNRRYLFGRIAEGTQRTMVQRKVSLAKIRDIFLSGAIDWQATGGLLGVFLTLADLKAASAADLEQVNAKLRSRGKQDTKSVPAQLNIHGGKNLVHMLATARRFILRKALPVHPRELRHDPRSDESKAEPDYEDENIRVWSIPVSVTPLKPSASEPHSPKKRKLGPASDAEAESEQDLAEEEADQRIREAVVKDMFCSKWNLDTLREMKLKDVQLPAKIFIRNDQGHIEPYDGPDPSSSSCPDINVLVRLPWPAAKIERLPPTSPAQRSMCYIVKCHPRRGKFNVEAATKLGVVKTDFKRLTMGQSVPGADGTIVTPDMVMGAQIDGRGFAILDIPFPDLIDPLLQRHEWSNPEIMKGIDTMYWILSDDITVSNDDRVQQFMKAHASIKHIILGSAMCPNVPGLESPTSQLIKMNGIDPQRFPLPVFDTKPRSDLDKELEPIAEVGRPGLQYQLAPRATFITDGVVPVMDTKRPIWELMTYAPQALERASAARNAIAAPSFLTEVEKSQHDLPSPETEIVPLGTGSAMPSKYRNVSATLIRVPGWGSYILDCGENTLGQLHRCFGYEGADEVLKDLRAIYISHLHADHHLGTVSVIARWRQLSLPADRKLAIIATPKYQDFVREVQSVQHLSGERLLHVTLRSTSGRPMPGTLTKTSFPDGVDPEALGLPRVEACFVDHCYEATAVVLTFPDTGLKIAYSGDCRPSATFAELGRGAHLLLHECTFEDELGGDALAKKHSTLSEALDVGRQMRARRILLTHFSQRYPKLPVINEAALGTEEEKESRDVDVLFAFDMMRLKLGEFKQAKAFLPALRELLQEGEKQEEEDEE